jgi:carboxylesterase
MIIPTAEPFLLPAKAGAPGCLLIHGFTGTPREMRWMGEYLSEQGYSVLAPRLTGHATRPGDMIRSRYTDWIASVEDGYHLLRGITPSIYLVGLSMGGVLALRAAALLDVRGVVALSAPHHMRPDNDLPVWLLKLFSRVSPFQPKSRHPGSEWVDQEARASHISYPQNPVRSAAELKLLLAEMRAALPQVRVPALLIHSLGDRTVLPDNVEAIYNELDSTDKQKVIIEGSGHVLTRDARRQDVFAATANFIKRIEAAQ